MIFQRKKVFFITTGAITLIVGAVLFVLLLNLQAFKPRIEAAASNALGMEVRIKGRLGITLFPGIGIALKDVSVRNRGADVVTVEKIKIGLEFIALTRHEVLIRRVGLIKPVLSIVRDKNGTFNFENPGRTPSGRPFVVETISIAQGRVVYIDARSGIRIEADDLDSAVQNLSYTAKDGAELFKNISFDGESRCKTLLINNVKMTNLVVKTTVGNGILELNPVSMNLLNGKGKASIHMDVSSASPHYHVIATLSRFRIEELIQSFASGEASQKSMEGAVNVTANLTTAGKSADEVTRSLNGDLSLNGEDLSLYSIDIDALIPKYERSQNFNLVDVGAYFLAGPFGPILTKSYNFASMYQESQVGKRSIQKLVSIWKIKNGIAAATDAAFATKKYRIAVKGGLDFNNEKFVDVTVAVLDKRGCAVYSQKVHGPFRKPRVEKVNIFRSLTGSLSNALNDARQFIQREKCEVFYSGSVAQFGE